MYRWDQLFPVFWKTTVFSKSCRYTGYLVHFPGPNPKNTNNNYPKKFPHIFQKKKVLIFWNGNFQPQAQKVSNIFPKQIFLIFRDGTIYPGKQNKQTEKTHPNKIYFISPKNILSYILEWMLSKHKIKTFLIICNNC